MMEFLIRRADGDLFDLESHHYAEVLRPSSFSSRAREGMGDHRIEVRGHNIVFSFEDSGIQVAFEEDDFTHSEASQITEEIAGSITKATGQESRVVAL